MFTRETGLKSSRNKQIRENKMQRWTMRNLMALPGQDRDGTSIAGHLLPGSTAEVYIKDLSAPHGSIANECRSNIKGNRSGFSESETFFFSFTKI